MLRIFALFLAVSTIASSPPPAARTERFLISWVGRTVPIEDQPDTYEVKLGRNGAIDLEVASSGAPMTAIFSDPRGRNVRTSSTVGESGHPSRVRFDAKGPGTYRIALAPAHNVLRPTTYEITSARVLDRAALAAEQAGRMIERRAVSAWIRSAGVTLRGSDLAETDNDIAPFAAALSGARIVGLGEVSHGSREIFLARGRLVQFLVRSMGFKVIALELDLAACRKIDDFVHGRTADSDFILKPWDTEEFLALIRWIKAYNASVAHDAQVTVIGIDGQDREAGKADLLAYLRRVAPDRADKANALFADTTFPLRLDAEAAERLQRGYVDLWTAMDFDGAKLIARSSRAEFTRMLSLVRAMSETGAMYRPDQPFDDSIPVRDVYMAENLRRVVDDGPAATKYILWAHNEHVTARPGGNPAMGYFLRRLYGSAYYALGSTFLAGSYQAWGADDTTLDDHRAPGNPDDAVEADFAASGRAPFLIDFRRASGRLPVEHWLASTHRHRALGASYAAGDATLVDLVPREAFDGELVIGDSTPARPSSRMRARFPHSPSAHANKERP